MTVNDDFLIFLKKNSLTKFIRSLLTLTACQKKHGEILSQRKVGHGSCEVHEK